MSHSTREEGMMKELTVGGHNPSENILREQRGQ